MKTLSQPALKQGDVLDGKYVLQECIGHGGMGSVFLAEQTALGRTVAVKVLHPELARCPAHAARIRDEAIAASRVHSAHCIQVIDCNALPDGGGSYLVMEYVPGRSLARIIAEEALPLSRIVELFEQILGALGSIHDAGVVHADVKCDNFLVESLEGRDHVTMIDFGLARLATSSNVELEDGQAVVSGTPEYMPPEVIAGGLPVTASDLYSAGVILYELLTGATPFAGGTAVEIMVRHALDVPVPPSLRRPDRNIPAALDRVVMRALEKRAEARFPDAATFAQAVREAMSTVRPSQDVASHQRRLRSDSPTRNYSAPHPSRRIARGSDCGAPAL